MRNKNKKILGQKILTFVYSVTHITPPSSLVDEMYKWIYISSALSTSNYRGTLDHCKQIEIVKINVKILSFHHKVYGF